MNAPATDLPLISDLHCDTPCVVAARRVLKMRLRAVERLLAKLPGAADVNGRDVHQLRVATRRAAAALRTFRDYGNTRTHQMLRKRLNDTRRRAAQARQADVQLAFLGEENDLPLSPPLRVALTRFIRQDRQAAAEALVAAAQDRPEWDIKKLRRRLVRQIDREAALLAGQPATAGQREPVVLTELAAQAMPALVQPFRDATRQKLTTRAGLPHAEKLHALRIAAKRLRYELEILGACFPPDFLRTHYRGVEAIQERLGAINDLHELTLRIASLQKAANEQKQPLAPRKSAGNGRAAPEAASRSKLLPDMKILAEELERRTLAAQSEFLDWWERGEARDTRAALLAMVPTARSAPAVARLPRLTLVWPGRVKADSVMERKAVQPRAAGPHRVAAIDVGSNSARMVVAETHPEQRFRVIEDFGETVRLASGLHRTGQLSHATMQEALAVLRQMRELAEHHHVDHLRAVGTSALREAKNGEHFVRMARKQTGIHLETISADYEARLAFSSVANAFDLTGLRVACVDLGGGSADVVITDSALIDSVHSLPLGAVRLTDRFSDATTPGVYHYAEMARFVDKQLKQHIPAPPPVDQIIGTGGTFTTLARISIRRAAAAHAEGRFPFALRGYEMTLPEVSEILQWLRKLPLEQRRKVAGLSERRSEIIVAGVCVIERLMRFLHADKLRVHDGGLRDGLLMEMIDDLHLPAQARTNSSDAPENDATAGLAAVRRAAERWEYERDHSEHVARLSMRILDQLKEQAPDGAAAWAQPAAREILHAAAILHDVGILIDLRRHHKHSYTMITHADLSPLSRRQVELIANVARYHRRAFPAHSHRNFRRLSVDDQSLIADLAGVLRVADGLDRSHTQTVRDVLVDVDGDHVRFTAHALGEADLNLRIGRKKSDLFCKRFGATVEVVAQPARGGATARVAQEDYQHVP